MSKFLLITMLLALIVCGFTLTGIVNFGTSELYKPKLTNDWSQNFGGTGGDFGYSIVQATDGGYTVAGYTTSFGAGGYDVYLVKTDSNGNMQWNKTYGGKANDYSYYIVKTSDGGYAIAGFTASFSVGGGSVYLIKTDFEGNVQWSNNFGTEAGYAWGFCLTQTNDGGYAVAGSTSLFGAITDDAYFVKTDSNGNIQWNKTYSGTGNEGIYSVVQTSDGGFALAGYTSSFGAGGYDATLIKTDSNGDVQWNKTYGGSGNDGAYSVVQNIDGGFTMAGYTNSFGYGSYDVYLVKTDSNGNIQWNKTYGGSGDDWGYSVVQTSDAGYAIAGSTGSFGAGGNDAYFVKTDSNGTMLFNKTFGGTGNDLAHSVVQTNSGGYAIAGSTTSFGAINSDVYLIHLEESAERNLAYDWIYALVGFVMFGMLYGIGINKPRGLSVKAWCYGYLTISITFDLLVIIALAGTPQFTWLTNLLLGLSAGAATGLALHVTHHITEEDQHNQEEPNKLTDLS